MAKAEQRLKDFEAKLVADCQALQDIKAMLIQHGKAEAELSAAIYEYLMASHQWRLEELVKWTANFMARKIAEGVYDDPTTAPEHVIFRYMLSYDAMLSIRNLNVDYVHDKVEAEL